MMELALPAGSLQSALQAFKAGADAVYLGMRLFSARKGATNFSFDDLAALRAIAQETHKKIYVTVNTIVTDDQMDEVVSLLREIAFIGCDGIIVQDLGIARIVRTCFPSVPLHGSTQLAVHTVQGVKAMQQVGFTRVVLARELTLSEIATIRKECPDVELKVFIHGALCYGMSGLCTASRYLCDRSANCGACAQICRTWFTLEQDTISALSPKPADKHLRDGWFFSMSDFNAGTLVRELDKMGIDSAKIEGRMKSPEYVAAAARYYRAILDGKDEQTVSELQDQLALTFERKSTKGWMGDYGRETQDATDRGEQVLSTVSYPGHCGIDAGSVNAILDTPRHTYIQATLSAPLAVRDGVMFLLPEGTVAPTDTLKFSIGTMYDRNGKPLTHAQAGTQVAIVVPADMAQQALEIQRGDILHKISAHDSTLSKIHDEQLPRAKRAVDMTITIDKDNHLTLSTTWDSDFLPKTTISKTYDIDISQAQKPQDVAGNLNKILRASDMSLLTAADINISNESGMQLQDIFLPLSQLKEIRRQWYEQLDDAATNWLHELRGNMELTRSVLQPLNLEPVAHAIKLPTRSSIGSMGQDGLPYLDVVRISRTLADITDKKLSDIDTYIPKVEETYYVCLPPVTFDEPTFMEALAKLVQELQLRDILHATCFGLNNIAHVRWAKKHPYVRTFCDIYLYLANAQAAQEAVSLVPGIEGGYFWLEQQSAPPRWGWPFAPTVVERSFRAPLFISRSCFRHDSLGLSCEGCPRRGNWRVSQHGKEYAVRVDGCITTVREA